MVTTDANQSRVRLLARCQATGLENARQIRLHIAEIGRRKWAVRLALATAHDSTLRTVRHMRQEQEKETALILEGRNRAGRLRCHAPGPPCTAPPMPGTTRCYDHGGRSGPYPPEKGAPQWKS